MRHDDGHGRKPRRRHRERERIAETDIERGAKAELRACLDREIPAMGEDSAAVSGRNLEDFRHTLIVETIAVHRGKKTNTPQAQVDESAPHTLLCVGRQRIQHEEADESLRVARDRRSD